MNTQRTALSGREQYHSLQILGELSLNDSITQRDLSIRLGIALGLVNSYIKNLVAKGYITVKAIPSKRYAYYLTPKGFAEKTRLTYDMLHDYTRIYREARQGLKTLFRELEQEGKRAIVFAGADEVAEIAYLTLQETGLTLSGILDGDAVGQDFFGTVIRDVNTIAEIHYDAIVITSYLKRDALNRDLLKHGAAKNTIRTVFPGY